MVDRLSGREASPVLNHTNQTKLDLREPNYSLSTRSRRRLLTFIR
jgi:hypothetical protein